MQRENEEGVLKISTSHCSSYTDSLSHFQRYLHAGAAPQKERGSGTSLSKAKRFRGEVSLLSANRAPRRARDNQRRQGFHLSSSALFPQTLGLYRQARGFCEGLSIVAPIMLKVKLSCAIVAPITLKIKSSCAFIITGVYGDHALSTCTEIKRANQKL